MTAEELLHIPGKIPMVVTNQYSIHIMTFPPADVMGKRKLLGESR